MTKNDYIIFLHMLTFNNLHAHLHLYNNGIFKKNCTHFYLDVQKHFRKLFSKKIKAKRK